MSSKYLVTTLGCKVNQYESQQLRDVLEAAGLRPAGEGEAPDLAIVNTCAVTAEALRQSQQIVRRFGRGITTKVIVVGCGASADSQRFASICGVDAVWGHEVDAPAELRKLLKESVPSAEGSTLTRQPAHLSADEEPDDRRNEQWMIAARQTVEQDKSSAVPSTPRMILNVELPLVNTPELLGGQIQRFHGHQRAYLKIQDGCDAHCTYCIIPRLRPTLRSKPVEAVVSEAAQLVRAGHREIVLTGVFLGAFGRDTAIRRRFGSRGSPLVGLLRALSRVPGLERLRMSSLEPGDVTDELLDAMSESRVCVPHLHLPLQSGSGAILRRMNRQYTRDEFDAMVDRVRSRLDEPAITTDIIVGFPGESEADFEATLDAVRSAQFCQVHAFPFSPREGTAANRWRREFIPQPLVRDRMQRLRQEESASSLAYRSRLVGRIERVIVESGTRADVGDRVGDRSERASDELGASDFPRGASPWRHGRADRFIDIVFASRAVSTGDVVRVQIERVTPRRTHGTVLDPSISKVRLAVLGDPARLAGVVAAHA